MYMDRHGNLYEPKDDDVIRARNGAFAIILSNDLQKILVTEGPHAVGVPELPGGGIDAGEDAEKAVIREIYEETNQIVKSYKVEKKWNFNLNFYADDVNEYWNYDKIYFLLQIDLKEHYFSEKIKTPEGGTAWWMNLCYIKNNPFRATDVKVLSELKYI
jgi:8-oxo-dGTP pyrophosphatase MutT (NUDIX family)